MVTASSRTITPGPAGDISYDASKFTARIELMGARSVTQKADR